MDISLVIPLLNESESLPELERWIREVCVKHNYSYEIVFIDDGSTDDSWKTIQKLRQDQPNTIKGVSFRRNYGKSAALNSGFSHVEGDVVITLDADLQDNPEEIPHLYKMITEEDYDLVSGWKKKRYDPITKTIPTKLFNATTRWVSGIHLHDFNCGIKAYKNIVVKNIEVYGEMHRYIPLIAKWNGFPKIGEHVVQHQSRKYGTTKFGGFSRFINGYLDLLSITFVGKFGKRPMHFFGAFGSIVFIIGFFILCWMIGYKWWCLSNGIQARLVADQPHFFIALTSMIVGTQLFLAGFIAELVARNSPNRNRYTIREKVGYPSEEL